MFGGLSVKPRSMKILIGFAPNLLTHEKFAGGCVASHGSLMNF